MESKVEDLSLPNAVVQRIIKEAVPPGTIVAKDARLAISRATSLFVLYIGQAAMEFAIKNKRKTVKESDLIDALKEAEFEDLIPLLEKEMIIAKEKKAKKAADKKSKKESEESVEKPDEDAQEDPENQDVMEVEV